MKFKLWRKSYWIGCSRSAECAGEAEAIRSGPAPFSRGRTDDYLCEHGCVVRTVVSEWVPA